MPRRFLEPLRRLGAFIARPVVNLGEAKRQQKKYAEIYIKEFLEAGDVHFEDPLHGSLVSYPNDPTTERRINEAARLAQLVKTGKVWGLSGFTEQRKETILSGHQIYQYYLGKLRLIQQLKRNLLSSDQIQVIGKILSYEREGYTLRELSLKRGLTTLGVLVSGILRGVEQINPPETDFGVRVNMRKVGDQFQIIISYPKEVLASGEETVLNRKGHGQAQVLAGKTISFDFHLSGDLLEYFRAIDKIVFLKTSDNFTNDSPYTFDEVMEKGKLE